MSEAFDPYYVWLGIPPDEQPPHHYRLLGVSVFESEPEVISTAADRQMSHVRKYQIGANAAASQRILNELATARRCLLDAKAKSAYDQQLRRREAKPAAGRPQPAARTATRLGANHEDKPVAAVLLAEPGDDFSPIGADQSPEVGTVQPSVQHGLAALKKKPAWMLAAGSVGVGLLLCGAVVAIGFALRGGDEEPPSNNSTATTSPVLRVAGNEDGTPNPHEHLAVLEAGDDCRWSDGASFEHGQRLVPGEKLPLTAGHVEIQYKQGPRVILEGPAEFELTSANRGLLRQGRATVVASGDEFAVATADGTLLKNNRKVLVNPDGSIAYLDEPPPTPNPAVPPAVSPAPRRGLVGHWPFDDDGRDATGHGYDAVFKNSPTYIAGPVGRAAVLAQNHFDLEQTMLDNAGQFTLATWVQITQPTQPLLKKLGGGFLFSGGSVNLTVSKDNVQLFLIGAAAPARPGEFRHTENWTYDFTPHTGRWTHVAVAYDRQAGQVECWIDGRSLGQRGTPSYPVRIANARFMMISGSVDDMRLYDIRLPDAAIKQLVAAGDSAVVAKVEIPTQPVTPGPERPVPPPTNTFDASGLAQAVTLPPTEDTAPVKLGNIPADMAMPLTLTLLGGDEAIKGSSLLALGDTSAGNATSGNDGAQVWPVHFSEDAEAFTPVAEFRRDAGQLSFHWTAGAVEHADAAALRNCLLKISAAGEQHVMRLREPLTVPPLAVDLVRGIHQAKIKLDDPPPVEEIYIELADIRVNFPGAPALSDTDRLIPLKGGQLALNFGGSTNMLRLTVLGNTSSGIVVSLKTDFLITTMSEPQPYTKSNIGKVAAPISKRIDQLTLPIAKLRAERRRTFYTSKMREIDRQLSVLEPQLATLQRAKQELLQLSNAYDVLHGNSKLHFRLKYAVGNTELLLAESRDQP